MPSRVTLGGRLLLAVIWLAVAGGAAAAPWTDAQREILASLAIDRLGPLPASPSNAVADDLRAARLGHRLFFDERLSARGNVACATCHQPARFFTDGLPLSRALGTTRRNAMPLPGAAWSPFQFWDGRKDSLWAQALGPLEDAAEHGGTRSRYAHLMVADPAYREAYQALFGTLPDLSDRVRFPADAGPLGSAAERAAWAAMAPADRDAISRVFANIGKAIEAYERRLVPGPARFDRYVKGTLTRGWSDVLSAPEEAGLALFIGAGQCTRCHNGPLFSNFFFHNTGVPAVAGAAPDRGRAEALDAVRDDPFNCLGAFSDAQPDQCSALRFMKLADPSFERGFKVPSLRGVGRTAPYMHAGQFATLAEVLRHYNEAPGQPDGQSELHPLGLSRADLVAIEAFLYTLDSASPAEPEWWAPPAR